MCSLSFNKTDYIRYARLGQIQQDSMFEYQHSHSDQTL